MNPIGLYQPGNSWLHRIPAGLKLLLLLVIIVYVVSLNEPWEFGVAAVAIAGVYAATGIRAVVAWRQLWPLRWMVLVVGVFQLIFSTWQQAVIVCAGLLLSVALAALLTLTTRVSAMLDVFQKVLRPLRHFGVDPDRVGLVLALTIRCVPLMVTIVDEVDQARKARGAGFSLQALAAPVVIRALRSADEIGDALVARGVDD